MPPHVRRVLGRTALGAVLLTTLAPVPAVPAQRGVAPPSDLPLIERIRQQPDDITGYLALSSLYYMTRRYEDAERFLMGALTLVRKRGAAAPAPAATAFLVSPARAGVDVGTPVKLRDVPADYPPAALDARRGGTVELEITIDERGLVSDARVTHSVAGLDEAALAAVRRWEFLPTIRAGRSLVVSMPAKMTFIPVPILTVPRDTRREVGTGLAAVGRSFQQGAFKDAELVLETLIGAVQRERDEPRADVTRSITTGRTSSDWPLRAGRDLPVPDRRKAVPPVFPETAGDPGGVVTFEFVVSPEGRATNLRVTGATVQVGVGPEGRAPTVRPAAGARPVLEQAAREALGQWEFVPTVLNDQPIPVAMSLTFNFSAARRAVDEVVRVGGEIQEPKKIKDVSPVYPREALAKRQSGLVILEAIISPIGKVTDLRVVRGVSEAFDKAAIAAVRQWEFIPTHVAGIPVAAVMTVTVSFNVR